MSDITYDTTCDTENRDPRFADLSDADACLLARADWKESGGTLTGAKLAERYGRSARWGQKQAAAARAERSELVPATVPPNEAPAPARMPRHAPANARPPSKRIPAARDTGTPVPLVAITVLAVVVVTTVCAVVSYVHIRHLAAAAGMGSLAGWLPLALDGMVVACSCSLLVDRHGGAAHGYWLARIGLGLGLAASLVANALAVDPGLAPLRAVRLVLAVYPPVALAVSGHLMLRMVGDR